MPNPIDVAITVDTEFSIGGAFLDSIANSPIGLEYVDCHACGVANGAPFIVDILKRYGLNATFFVETMQVAYFGDAPMGGVVEHLLRRGQDVQLHLHPCWAWFKDPQWRERLQREQPNDDCATMSVEILSEFIAEGIATLARWGCGHPRAFRSGNLKAARNIYRAMHDNSIGLASTIGYGLLPPAEQDLHLRAGLHLIDGIVEVPVTTYTQFDVGFGASERLFAVTASAFSEMTHLLAQAHAAQISPVVILTHPFEFVKSAPPGKPGVKPNRINKSRFERLCCHLADHTDKYRAVTFSSAADRWIATASGTAALPILRVPLPYVAMRMATNKLNDFVKSL